MTDSDIDRGSKTSEPGTDPERTDTDRAGQDTESGESLPGLDDIVEVDVLEAKASALGNMSAVELSATGSAIANANVEGDAEISNSLVGMINAGSVGLYRGGALVMVADGEAAIEQGFADVVVTRAAGLNRSGAAVVVAGDASVARSWVGVMATRNATISDDSRVIVDARAGLIIGLLALTGLGLVAWALYPRRRRMLRGGMWNTYRRMAKEAGAALEHVDLGDLSKIAKRIEKMKLADLASMVKLGH